MHAWLYIHSHIHIHAQSKYQHMYMHSHIQTNVCDWICQKVHYLHTILMFTFIPLLDEYINRLTVHVFAIAKSLTVCFTKASSFTLLNAHKSFDGL